VDLSVGSGVSLSAVVAAVLIVRSDVSPVVACIAAVVVLAGVGLGNGLLVTRLGLSPIIVTLGSLTALRGIGMLVAPDPVYGLGDAFSEIGYTGIFGIPYLVVGAAVIVGIGAWVLAWSPVGRHVLAIGVNEEAAFLSGISTRRTILAGYVITAAAAGIAGVMYAMLLNSAPSGTLGVGFELDVLTAVMLGGVAFNGGRGTVHGVVLGVLFLAVLQNGLILLNVPTSVALVIKGGALVVAATLDRATLKAMFAVKGR
jgi:ribose transport system permease protein